MVVLHLVVVVVIFCSTLTVGGFLNLPKWFPPKETLLSSLRTVWEQSLQFAFQFSENGLRNTGVLSACHSAERKLVRPQKYNQSHVSITFYINTDS